MEGFVEGANNNSCNFESRILLHQKDHFISSIRSSQGGQESDSALKSWFFVEVSDRIFLVYHKQLHHAECWTVVHWLVKNIRILTAKLRFCISAWFLMYGLKHTIF